MDIFQNLVSVIEAIIALANLIVIIYFTYTERKEKRTKEKEESENRKKEKEEDIQQRRREIIYSKIIAGTLFEVVERYFDDCVKMVEQIMQKNYVERPQIIEELSIEFQAAKRTFKQTILSVLGSLNRDAYMEVKEFLEIYEDRMMYAFEKNPISWYATIQCIDKTRVEIMKCLLKMELKI